MEPLPTPLSIYEASSRWPDSEANKRAASFLFHYVNEALSESLQKQIGWPSYVHLWLDPDGARGDEPTFTATVFFEKVADRRLTKEYRQSVAQAYELARPDPESRRLIATLDPKAGKASLFTVNAVAGQPGSGHPIVAAAAQSKYLLVLRITAAGYAVFSFPGPDDGTGTNDEDQIQEEFRSLLEEKPSKIEELRSACFDLCLVLERRFRPRLAKYQDLTGAMHLSGLSVPHFLNQFLERSSPRREEDSRRAVLVCSETGVPLPPALAEFALWYLDEKESDEKPIVVDALQESLDTLDGLTLRFVKEMEGFKDKVVLLPEIHHLTHAAQGNLAGLLGPLCKRARLVILTTPGVSRRGLWNAFVPVLRDAIVEQVCTGTESGFDEHASILEAPPLRERRPHTIRPITFPDGAADWTEEAVAPLLEPLGANPDVATVARTLAGLTDHGRALQLAISGIAETHKQKAASSAERFLNYLPRWYGCLTGWGWPGADRVHDLLRDIRERARAFGVTITDDVRDKFAMYSWKSGNYELLGEALDDIVGRVPREERTNISLADLPGWLRPRDAAPYNVRVVGYQTDQPLGARRTYAFMRFDILENDHLIAQVRLPTTLVGSKESAPTTLLLFRLLLDETTYRYRRSVRQEKQERVASLVPAGHLLERFRSWFREEGFSGPMAMGKEPELNTRLVYSAQKNLLSALTDGMDLREGAPTDLAEKLLISDKRGSYGVAAIWHHAIHQPLESEVSHIPWKKPKPWVAE